MLILISLPTKSFSTSIFKILLISSLLTILTLRTSSRTVRNINKKIRNCVTYAQLAMKKRYDNSRMPFIINSGDKAFINLHEGYRIFNTKGKKLGI
jgi:hypothetical protein